MVDILEEMYTTLVPTLDLFAFGMVVAEVFGNQCRRFTLEGQARMA